MHALLHVGALVARHYFIYFIYFIQNTEHKYDKNIHVDKNMTTIKTVSGSRQSRNITISLM